MGESLGLCTSCQLELPTTDYAATEGNLTELRLTGRVPFRAATSLFYFRRDEVSQRVVHQIKYYSHRELARTMGRLLGSELAASHRFDTVDVLMPVPLHWLKRLHRGYNQSLLLCRGIADTFPRPVSTHNLVRTRFTDSQ